MRLPLLPPLKGEVAFHHVSDEMTEGSAVEEPNCSFSMYWHKRLKYENFGKKSLADTGYEENRQISAAAESVSLIIIFIQKGEESHEIYQT